MSIIKVFNSNDTENKISCFINMHDMVTINLESDNTFDTLFCFETPEEAIEFTKELKSVAEDLIMYSKNKNNGTTTKE